LIPTIQRLRYTWAQLLVVDEGEVGTVQVLNEPPAVPESEPGMTPAHATFPASMRHQIHVWKHTANEVLAPHKDIRFIAEVEVSTSADHH